MPRKRDWFDRAMDRTDTGGVSGCWLYRGEIVHNGYGRISYEGRNVRIHRLSYEVFCGDIPVDLMVCHRCDVRNCWNPAHLFLGTAMDNLKDAISKGRFRTVEKKPKGPRSSKLTPEKVSEIKAHLANGLKGPELGALYGVDKSSIYKIKNGHHWRDTLPNSPAT